MQYEPTQDNVTRLPNHAGSKLNVEVDEPEYVNRGYADLSQTANNVACVFQNDLLFQRVGGEPSPLALSGIADSHVRVFATWNGITHQKENEFSFFGVACNDAEHQERNGPLGKQFASWTDGTATIVCRSTLPIRKGRRVAWRIPRSIAVAGDPTKAGRLLVELYEFTTDSINLPTRLYNAVASSQYGIAPSDDQVNETQLMLAMNDKFLAMAFTGIVSFIESDNDAPGGKKLTPSEKLRIAAIVGLTSSGVLSAAEIGSIKKRSALFQRSFADSLYQKQFNPQTKVSQKNENALAFPLTAASLRQPGDQRAVHVAQAQANQVGSLFDLFVLDYDAKLATVIGVAKNGGTPNQWMDIELRRQ